jgi:hypothetical protein
MRQPQDPRNVFRTRTEKTSKESVSFVTRTSIEKLSLEKDVCKDGKVDGRQKIETTTNKQPALYAS